MSNIVVPFNNQQVQKIEQIVMDNDEHEAMIFLKELNKKIEAVKIGCNPLDFRIGEGVEGIIEKAKKQSI